MGQHERMDHDEAADRLCDVVAPWSAGDVSAADIVRAVCDLLVAGGDGPPCGCSLRCHSVMPTRRYRR